MVTGERPVSPHPTSHYHPMLGIDSFILIWPIFLSPLKKQKEKCKEIVYITNM